MADELGTAVLRITADDSAARQALKLLRQDVEQLTTRAARAASSGRAQGGAREGIRALEQAQERRFRLAQRIQRLEDQGVNVSRLRARLGDATTAQSQRAFEQQRRISVELSRQVRLAEARFRREQQLQTLLDRQARAGGPAEAVRGRVGLTGSPADLAFLARQGGPRSPIGGAVGIAGSPAAVAAELRALAIEAKRSAQELAKLAALGGPRSPLRGAVDIPGSPAFIEAQRRLQAGELSRAARLGGPRSPVGGAVNIPDSPAAIRAEQELARARERAAAAALKAAQAEGARVGRLNVSPVRGGAAFPGSPKFLEQAFPQLPASYFSGLKRRADQQAKRQADIVSNALIGGAFPLLFGQGIGAAIGGAGGGAAGGAIGGQFGFGLSLAGTALGAQFDAILTKAVALGRGLEDPIRNFSAIQEAALLSSRGLERQVESLIAVGREAEAAALIQADLARSYGGAEAARRLADEQDRLNRSWSDLSVNLGQLAVPAVADLFKDLADTLTGLKPILEAISRLPIPKLPTPLGIRPPGPLAALNPASAILGVSAELGRREAPQQEIRSAQELAAASEVAARAEKQRRELLSTQLNVITAQVQGYSRLALERERELSVQQQQLDIDRLRARQAGRPEIEAREQQGTVERARIQERINVLERDRLAALVSQTSQFRLVSAELDRQFTTTQRLSQIQTTGGVSILRDNAQFVEGINQNIRASVQTQQRIAAEIRSTRIRGGGESEDQIRRLTREQTQAAQQTRNVLADAALQLRDAGQQLARDLRQAVVGFTQLRSDPNGLNRFLSPQAQGQRSLSDFQRLLPRFREAQGRFFQLTGQRAPDFRGPTADVNAILRDFINAVDNEFNATEALNQTTAALDATNKELISANRQLATATAALADKDWNVYLEVPGGGGARAFGDAQNRALA